MLDPVLIKILVAGSLIAAAGGLLGSFALLRRMALVGDALSHVAFPGLALGFLFHFNVFLGSLVFLIIGTVGIWAIEHKTKLPVDTLTGIFFTIALAIGAIIAPPEEILEALFGEITKITWLDFWLASFLSILIIAILIYFARKLTISMISPELALSLGFKPHLIELLFLLIFALVVALGIQFTGALLMGALIIIPAAAARNFAGSMKAYMAISALLGIVGAISGITLSYFYSLPPGPTFILSVGLIFFISIAFRK